MLSATKCFICLKPKDYFTLLVITVATIDKIKEMSSLLPCNQILMHYLKKLMKLLIHLRLKIDGF